MQAVPPPAPVSHAHSRGSVAAAAREFEAVFLSEMLKPMLEGMAIDGPFGGGHGEEMFRGVLAEELGRSLARRGGVGLARSVDMQLVGLQEAASHGR